MSDSYTNRANKTNQGSTLPSPNSPGLALGDKFILTGTPNQTYQLERVAGIRAWVIVGGSAGWPKYVVSKLDPLAPYTTIQAAIDAAFAAGHGPQNPAVVLVHPATYVENLVLRRGIHLASFINEQNNDTIIQGTCTLAGNGVAGFLSTLQITGFHLVPTGPFFSATIPAATDPLGTFFAFQNCTTNSLNRLVFLASDSPIGGLVVENCDFSFDLPAPIPPPPFETEGFLLVGRTFIVKRSRIRSAASATTSLFDVNPLPLLIPQVTITDSELTGTGIVRGGVSLSAMGGSWADSGQGPCLSLVGGTGAYALRGIDLSPSGPSVISLDVGSAPSAVDSRGCTTNGEKLLTDRSVSAVVNRTPTARTLNIAGGVLSAPTDVVLSQGLPVQLPPIGQLQDGDRITVVGAGNSVTVTPDGTDTIAGAPSYVIPPGCNAEFQASNALAAWVVTVRSFTPRTARFIVGNALAGDTAAECDFLDPGDGTGILAAITAANSAGQGDVFIRSGTYTLVFFVGITAFQINPNVTVRGAGPETLIVGTSNFREVFFVQGTLHDLRIQMPEAAPILPFLVTGDLVVRQDSDSVVRDVEVEILGATNVLETLLGLFGCRLAGVTSGIRCLDCNGIGPGTIRAPGPVGGLVAAFSFESISNAQIRGKATGLDALLRLGGPPVPNFNCDVELDGDCYKAGVVGGRGHRVRLTCAAHITAPELENVVLVCNDLDRSILDAVLTNEAALLSTLILGSTTCSRNTFRATLADADTGIELLGDRNMVNGSVLTNIATDGVRLTAPADRNTVTSNTIEAATPINIAGATNTIAANNQ